MKKLENNIINKLAELADSLNKNGLRKEAQSIYPLIHIAVQDRNRRTPSSNDVVLLMQRYFTKEDLKNFHDDFPVDDDDGEDLYPDHNMDITLVVLPTAFEVAETLLLEDVIEGMCKEEGCKEEDVRVSKSIEITNKDVDNDNKLHSIAGGLIHTLHSWI